MIASPPGTAITDAIHLSHTMFAVADGVDHRAGSGEAALTDLLSRLPSLTNHRRLRGALHTAGWSLRLRADPARARDHLGVASVTLAAWTGVRFLIGHIGDTRAYLYRRGTLSQLTRDRLLPARPTLGEAGPLDQDDLVVRLGQDLAAARPDLLSVTVSNEDRLLLCSDGLWRNVEDRHLASALDGEPRDCCAALRHHTDNTGPENAAAIVIAVRPGESPPPARPAGETAGLDRSRPDLSSP